MPDVAIARALHVLAVVWWIGGVAIVTTVILPAASRAGFAYFEQAEHRFAMQARIAKRFHWIMLALSMATILGAVAGSHGLPLF